jgi:hypothetical protein
VSQPVPSAPSPPQQAQPAQPAQVAPAAQPAAPPAATLYLPEEALADAMSGPLEVVGVGGWPTGEFRRTSCVYRNARVFVVDEVCASPAEGTRIHVHILSPTRGHASIYADGEREMITQARRADYTQLGTTNYDPKPPPARLDLAMSYEQLYDYADVGRGKIDVFCTSSIQAPQGHCSQKSATISPSDYAAKVSGFIAQPPDRWYAFVHTVVDLRKTAFASIQPAKLPVPRLVTWGSSVGRDLDVTVTETTIKRVGTPDVSSAIVVTEDGGAAIAGTRSSGPNNVMPAVARVDATGKKVWVKTFAKTGFVGHEDTTILAHHGSLYVLAHAFPKLMLKPISRVFKLTAAGAIAWEWQGRAKPDQHRTAIPQVLRLTPTPQGTLQLIGFIQLVPDGEVHGWTGELDENGKVLHEEVGAVLPDGGRDLE